MTNAKIRRTTLVSILTVIMLFTSIFCIIPTGITAHAAAKYSTTFRGYIIPSYNIPAFLDANLTQRSGTVFPTDEVYICGERNGITSKSILIAYKISKTNEYQVRWVDINHILTSTKGKNSTCTAYVTVFKRPGGASYGKAYPKDICWLSNSISGNYVQIRYPVENGEKFKFGFIHINDLKYFPNYNSNSNDFIKESSLKAAASTYGISTNSNAYAALKLINTKYAKNLSQSDKNGVLIFMFEGVGNSSSTSKRENAMCVVVKNGNIVYINKNSSSIPDYPFLPSKNGGDPMPTLKSGIYNFSTVNHRNQYAALRVQNANVVRFRSASSWYSSTSSAINIHRKSSDNIASRNASWVNSAGCQLVGKAGTSSSSEYAMFIKSVGIVNNSASGNSKYNYSVSGKYILDRTYAHDYMRNIGYSENAIKAIG